MSDNADEAEKIRLKRLAKLGSLGPSSSSSTPPPEKPPVDATSRNNRTAISRPTPQLTAALPVAKKIPRVSQTPIKIDLDTWSHKAIEDVFLITLDRSRAEQENWRYVWLKSLQQDLAQERPAHSSRLTSDDVDRVLITRLEIDADSMSFNPLHSDDLEFLPVLASLPVHQTVFEYLVGCWRRLGSLKSALSRSTFDSEDAKVTSALLEKMRDLVVSYIGLTLQEPSMFPQPTNKTLGAPELLPALLSMVSLSGPLSNISEDGAVLPSQEVESFISDLERRFPSEEEGLDEIMGPIVRLLLFNQLLARPEGLAGGDTGWRTVLAGLGALVGHKGIAQMITRLEEWCPEDATAATVERVSLLGPLTRLGVFEREWPAIAKTYFSNPEGRSRADIDSSNTSLRATLNALQVINAIVRTGPAAREQVLQYFGRIINLNIKRSGLQVDPATVSSDGFLINIHAILLRLAEPFMDAKFTKLDRIDARYMAISPRMTLLDETRINATAEEYKTWSENLKSADEGTVFNFITEIFFLAAAANHYGLVRTVEFEQELHKAVDERQRIIERYSADTSWQTSPIQARVQTDIDRLKNEVSQIHSEMFAYQVQLLDPALISRNLAFTGFLSTWLIRLVDKRKRHPNERITLPLQREVPVEFSMLPEFFVEAAVDYYLYLMRQSPDSLHGSSSDELVTLCMAFLTSTWYIKNPFLKAKLVQLLFLGTLGYGRDRKGILTDYLNSNPLCLEHLMSALTGFYIEVESTGSHSQFYDKFNARRDIAYILTAIWHTPGHRTALKRVSSDLDKFVRFINLMMNDVTFLLDESLSKLTEISGIQHEMEGEEWNQQTPRHRQERSGLLHSLGGQATSWLSLGKSTLDLLQKFTAETRAPFMVAEIVDRLAAMLNYNLDALVGPKNQDLIVKNPEKYRFDPRALLRDVLQVYLNLCEEPRFITAVASDGRSYRASLFDRAASIARQKALKTDSEIEQLRVLVEKVELERQMMIDEDLGEIPDEFLDPLMYTLMRDPVILPSSRTVIDRSTIRSHLLSDSTDPFNRVPLRIEDVIPDGTLKASIEAFLLERKKRREQQSKGTSMKTV